MVIRSSVRVKSFKQDLLKEKIDVVEAEAEMPFVKLRGVAKGL